MYKNHAKKDSSVLAALKKRVEQNYADFKAEILSLLDEEEIYDMAHRIAAVRDTYEQLTSNNDYLDDEDAEFLLRFYNPLELLADYLQERQAGYPVEIDEALMELFDADGHEENYLTVDLAGELADKYGNDVRIKAALLMETIEAGEKYVSLMKLAGKADPAYVRDYNDLSKPIKSYLFGSGGFFSHEDDKEGCF